MLYKVAAVTVGTLLLGAVALLLVWGDFQTFCHPLADRASVLGLWITLLGFAVTLFGIWRIHVVARRAIERIGTLLVVAETGKLLRLVTEAKTAGRDRQWERVLDRCQEARLVALPLAGSACLLDSEQQALRVAANELRLVSRYIEDELIPAGATATALADRKRNALDRIITNLGAIQGRLQHLSVEV